MHDFDANRERSPLAENLAAWPNAEVFFLTAFRCWLAGYETGDIACWELAWRGASRLLPLGEAKRTIAEVGHFTRVFRETLGRRFTFLPYCCGHATAEERGAVRLVCAAQHGDIDAARQLAQGLTAAADSRALIEAAVDLGSAFRTAGLKFAHIDSSAPIGRKGLH